MLHFLWKDIQSQQYRCRIRYCSNMKILPLKNNGNIIASIIYLFIENDGIDALSVEEHI